MILASGKGSCLKDINGHKYLDLCGEYSTGLIGHSHPVINKSMRGIVETRFALGGVKEILRTPGKALLFSILKHQQNPLL